MSGCFNTRDRFLPLALRLFRVKALANLIDPDKTHQARKTQLLDRVLEIDLEHLRGLFFEIANIGLKVSIGLCGRAETPLLAAAAFFQKITKLPVQFLRAFFFKLGPDGIEKRLNLIPLEQKIAKGTEVVAVQFGVFNAGDYHFGER